jgi:hypothetical protein
MPLNENDSPIKKALRRLESVEVRVIYRGGEPVKIPAQVIKTQEKDGVIIVYEIPGDIV